MIENQLSKSTDFNALLQEAAAKRKYLNIHYYSDLHELLKVTSVVKELVTRQGQSYLQLASGEEIPVSQLVKVGNTAAPGHETDDFYSCSCS